MASGNKRVHIDYSVEIEPFKAMKALREKTGLEFLTDDLKGYDFTIEKNENWGMKMFIIGNNGKALESAEWYMLVVSFDDHSYHDGGKFTMLNIRYNGPAKFQQVAQDAYNAVARKYFEE